MIINNDFINIKTTELSIEKYGQISLSVYLTRRSIPVWGTISNAIDAFEPSTAWKTTTIRTEGRKSDSTA